jgi:hypothetical protein
MEAIRKKLPNYTAVHLRSANNVQQYFFTNVGAAIDGAARDSEMNVFLLTRSTEVTGLIGSASRLSLLNISGLLLIEEGGRDG